MRLIKASEKRERKFTGLDLNSSRLIQLPIQGQTMRVVEFFNEGWTVDGPSIIVTEDEIDEMIERLQNLKNKLNGNQRSMSMMEAAAMNQEGS